MLNPQAQLCQRSLSVLGTYAPQAEQSCVVLAGDQCESALVMEIAALVGHVDVQPRNFLTRFQPPARTLLSPRQFPLSNAQPPFGRSEVTRVGDLSPVAKNRECCQSNVDANGQVARDHRLGLTHLHAEAHKPAAGFALGRHGLDRGVGGQRTMPLQLEVTHTLQI